MRSRGTTACSSLNQPRIAQTSSTLGWTPTVVTLERSAYEGRLDPGLEALVPGSVRVVRAAAWPAAVTRQIGLGDLGLRAFTGLRHTCRALLSRERFDALFITVYPVYPALLGAGLKAAYRVPFVLDYQDPWVGAWGQSVGGGPGGAPDWKSRASRRLGTWLEPRAVNAADAIVAVSQGTIDGIVERIPAAAHLPQGVIPLGFEADDFAALRARPALAQHFAHGEYRFTAELVIGRDGVDVRLNFLRRGKPVECGELATREA